MDDTTLAFLAFSVDRPRCLASASRVCPKPSRDTYVSHYQLRDSQKTMPLNFCNYYKLLLDRAIIC